MNNKIGTEHLTRKACVYIRQSTSGQVLHCKESQRLQYGLVERAKGLGWAEESIKVIDCDLGTSASGSAERKGFQELLSGVCEGKIGAVFSVEASRLARNGREWHTLLEICGVMRTVLVDQENIYDPNLSTDRMVLGLKGEMSNMELNLLRERSQAALKAMASRGELYLTISSGYVKTENNKLKKDPDKRIQEALDLVFNKFRELGSTHQVCNWFVSEQVEIPMVSNDKGERCIKWKLPTPSTISRILSNPIYAGVYTYGRTKTEVEYINGRKQLRKGIRKEQKDWDVLILDHHEGYITWDEYQSNRKIIFNNMNRKRLMAKGSVRGGEALLAGLLRCGHCGCKLYVRYHGDNGSHKRYDCSGKRSHGKRRCISFGGLRVDKAVTKSLLNVLSPMGLEYSIKAIEKINEKNAEVRRQYELSLEQANYEARLAERRFKSVDPDNRLVAASLEQDWNDSLTKVSEIEDKIASLSESKPLLSLKEETEIKEIAQNLPRIWNHASSSPELKKRIIRTVIKEIIVYVREQNIKLIIHWEGGDHTELEVKKNKSGGSEHRTDKEIEEIITGLARMMPDREIVIFLNRLGKTTAEGLNWNPVRIRAFRSNHNIPVYREGESQERKELKIKEASSKLGIGRTKVLRLIHHKILPARRVCEGAPWIIAEKDIQAEAVKKAAHSKLPKGPCSDNFKQEVLNFQ